MPSRSVLLVTLLLLLIGAGSGAAMGQESGRAPFDYGWRFKKDDAPGAALDRDALAKQLLPTSAPFIKDPTKRPASLDNQFGSSLPYVDPGFDDHDWQPIDLPHDWAIAGPFRHEGGGGTGRLPYDGVGWYRKRFTMPASDAGRSVLLDFDGAMSYTAVWLNGHLVGGWPYGYASWRAALTPYILPGRENVLAVRLDNPGNGSRWYPGGGLYRHVWLVGSAPVHIGHWGTSITTPNVSPASASVDLDVTVDNDSASEAQVGVRSEIYRLNRDGSRTGRPVAVCQAKGLSLPAGGSRTCSQQALIDKPMLWGPPPTQAPNRYVAVTSVLSKGQVVDTYETPFGIRTVKFTPNEGMLINGKRVEIQGVCDHHDLGALGAAVNESALHRQLDMLIEMGVNAIRTSHNPPAPELLEYADRKGLIVMDEFTDVWEAQKTPLDYHRLFDDWHEQDLRALIRRDRNHPSVVMWSIGNEVGEQFRGAAGAKIGQGLTEIAHDEDPTRPTTTAMNAARADGPFPGVVDLIGLNYQGTGVRSGPPQYPVFHDRYPDKFVYGSETTSTISTRGEYYFPVTPGLGVPASATAGEDPVRHQLSSYDLYSAPWSYSPDKEFISLDRWPYVGGEFVWTGWDYLGEPTPFDTSRSSYFGIIDLAGFKKDRFYLYQARWRPDLPMAHIVPQWTWPEREGSKDATPVHVYTSGDEAELFLNGKSLGRKKKGRFEYRLRWDDVIYGPGTLKVVAYNDGQPWATEEVRTAGQASRLDLKPDRKTIRADGRDLAFLTLTIQDQHGVTVPRAHPHVMFHVEGPAEIVATDNGDPTDFTPFPSHERDAFNGLLLVIVRGKLGHGGRIRVTAESAGLKASVAEVTAVAPKR